MLAAMNSSTILISFSPTPRGEDRGLQQQSTTPSLLPTNDTGDAEPPLSGSPYSAEMIILFLMLVLFFVLGVVGNALAFYIYYQKRDKTTSTLFILSLAATDFLTCLIVIPYTLVTEMIQYWLVYDLVCKGYLFCMTFNIPLSAFIMVAVGFDRYFCICHPFLHAMTIRRAKICLVCLILLACGLGIVPALGHGVYYTKMVEELVPAVEGTRSSSAASMSVSSTTSRVESPYEVHNSGSSLDLVSMGGSSPYDSTPTTTTTRVDTLSNGNGSEVVLDGVVYRMVNTTRTIYYGYCVPNTLIFSEHFVDIYQKCYAATFLFSFLIIALLYALIYRSILIRRAWKAKRKRMSCYSSTITTGPETVAEETQLTNINNDKNNGGGTGGGGGGDAAPNKVTARTSVALRDRMLYANIKTAAMLFVVTVVFIISFLPSWLIGLEVMDMSYLLFYIFFLNNVANPFIYAFMNRTFRDDLRQLLKRIKNRLSGW